jgi:hypothetical protein
VGTGGFFPAMKRPGREADHSSLLVLRLRMNGALPPTIVACTWIFLRLRDHRAIQFCALSTNGNVVKETNNKTPHNLNLSAQWDALFRVLLNVL